MCAKLRSVRDDQRTDKRTVSKRRPEVIENELFERGLTLRREVLGEEYVDASIDGSDEFVMSFQRVVTELVWGYTWSRPGLDRKTRSMLNLAILTALGRSQELAVYAKGALRSGVSVDEIREILVHATIYCGTPAGRQAFLAVDEVLRAEGVAPDAG
jgi:4-carboxymuconolactone decarboxylase